MGRAGSAVEKALLADFGEAKQLKRTMTARGTKAGTPVYMAPEMREDEDIKGPKADVFSVGVVMVDVQVVRYTAQLGSSCTPERRSFEVGS